MPAPDEDGAEDGVVLYGASGFALSMAEMIIGGPTAPHRVLAFIDDGAGDATRIMAGAPVISFGIWQARFRAAPCVVAVGNPANRRRLVDRVAGAGGRFATVIRPDSTVSATLVAGEGTVIGHPAYVGPLTRMGRHVRIMPMAVVGHDVTLGDFVTVCSSASIAGYVTVEEGCFIGAGAVIVNGTEARPLRIGAGATVGAGAVVTKPVAAGMLVAGNPARPLRELARRARRPG